MRDCCKLSFSLPLLVALSLAHAAHLGRTNGELAYRLEVLDIKGLTGLNPAFQSDCMIPPTWILNLLF